MLNSFCDKCQHQCRLKEKPSICLCGCCEDRCESTPKEKPNIGLCRYCTNQCSPILKKTSLLFKNYDKYKNKNEDKKYKKSVDALLHTDSHLFLIEIKNQPTPNIEPKEIESKIQNTLEDLKKRGCNLNKRRLFFLSIPEKKLNQTPKHTPASGKLDYCTKIGKAIYDNSLNIFRDRTYTTEVANTTYQLMSHIVSCQDLENRIIRNFTPNEKKAYIQKF